MVTGIYEGLPAHAAGIGEFDIIVEIDGDGPATAEDIRAALEEKDAGDAIEFTVIQEGARRRVEVNLEAWDMDAFESANMIGAPAQADAFFDGEQVRYIDGRQRSLMLIR